MSNTRAKLESLRERIQDSSDLSDDDRAALLEFSDTLYLLKSEYSDLRHMKLLRHCTIMAETIGGLAESLHEKGTAEDLVRWINVTHENPVLLQTHKGSSESGVPLFREAQRVASNPQGFV